LVGALSHPNGWRRQTAQRLLVERQDPGAAPRLKSLAVQAERIETQLHALWTLEGLGALDLEVLLRALNDSNPKVQVHAIRLSEAFFDSDLLWKLRDRLLELANSAPVEVLRQLALSFGELGYSEARPVFLKALEYLSDSLMREALMTGVGGHELDFLQQIISKIEVPSSSGGARRMVRLLAKAIFVSRDPEAATGLINLLDSASEKEENYQTSMLDGILAAVPKPKRGQPAPIIHPIVLTEKPKSIAALEKGSEKHLEILNLIDWPESGNDQAVEAKGEVRPLTQEEQALFNLGLHLYAATCAACHQPHGNGQPGLAPPLKDSEWIYGPDERLIRIVLQGVQGPMTVKGETYQLAMPGLSVFNDEQVAAILTFIRRNWEHTGDPVPPEKVREVRAETAERIDMWTEEELLAIP
jgi:mono/diheme cytochrome c family protein